jgi:hypothetical protein
MNRRKPVVNGIRLTDEDEAETLDTPHPGGNLFSLASGGAIFVGDLHRLLTAVQLNGGGFQPCDDRDWALIAPYMVENARLFGIPL